MSIIIRRLGCLNTVLMKILSWNIRGFGRSRKWRKIKAVLRDRSVDLVFFQEAKKDGVTGEFIRAIWHGEEFDFMVVDPERRAGGLLCVWNPAMFKMRSCCSNKNFI